MVPEHCEPPRKALRLQLIWWHRTLEGPRPGRSGFGASQRVADVPVGRGFNRPVAAIEPVRRDACVSQGKQVDLREVARPHELRELPPQQLVRRERVVCEQLFRRTLRRPRCCTSTTLTWRCGEKSAGTRASSARPPRRRPLTLELAQPAAPICRASSGFSSRRETASASARGPWRDDQAGAAVFNHLGSPPTAVTTTGFL